MAGRDEFAVYRRPGARLTAPVAMPRERSALTVARAPKPKPLPKQKPRGGWKELGQAAGSAIVQTPGGAVDLAGMIPGAARAVGDYVASHTPGQVLDDAASLGGRALDYVRENPAETLADTLPFVGDIKQTTEMLREAADARAAGDLETARAIERFTGPITALTVAPDLGMTKLLRRGKAVAPEPARPRYHVSEEGPYLSVRREGVEPQVIPEAQDASLPAIRRLLTGAESNPALRAADEYSRAELGRPYTDIPDPGTSLEKQGGIARAYDLAASGDPAYKHATFEEYGNLFPDVVEASRAQNYDQLTEAAYTALGDKAVRQFDRIPLTMKYHFGEGEYPTPSRMLQDVLGTGNLNVFRGGDPHPFLGRIDPATKLSLNEIFRADHDFYGHGIRGSTFRPGGEEIGYASHAGMMDPLEQMALLSETRGQNSWVNYGPANADLYHQMNTLRDRVEELQMGDRMRGQPGRSADEIGSINAQLRELGGQTQVAPQLPLLMPPQYLDPATKGGVPDYLRELIKPAHPLDDLRGVHLSHTPGLTATDPSFYGTGHRGDDWALRGKKGSPAQHTSFYTGDPGTVIPERMVEDISPHAYEARLSGLYNLGTDPDKLATLARSYNVKASRMGNPSAHLPDLARLVREYGYSGYYNPGFLQEGRGAANVFDPVAGLKPIERGPTGYAKGGLVRVPAASAPRIMLPGGD